MNIYFVSKSSYQQTFMIPFKKPQFYQFLLFGTFHEFYLKSFIHIVYYAEYLLKIVQTYFCVVYMIIFFSVTKHTKKLLLLFQEDLVLEKYSIYLSLQYQKQSCLFQTFMTLQQIANKRICQKSGTKCDLQKLFIYVLYRKNIFTTVKS